MADCAGVVIESPSNVTTNADSMSEARQHTDMSVLQESVKHVRFIKFYFIVGFVSRVFAS
jgi:hypothetical protein